MNAPLITAPGFYPAITCEQYFAEPCPAPALTNSGIKQLLGKCPAYLYHCHPALGGGGGPEKTAPMARGNLVHRLSLGKGDDYAISPFDEYRSAAAKEWKEIVESAGQMPVKQKDYDQAEAMASIMRDRISEACGGLPYETEVVIAWQEQMSNGPVWCRAMLDVWCPDGLLAFDLKTCADASDEPVQRAFANGYATQDAWYRRGLEKLTAEHGRVRFGFLFVESDEPHLTRTAQATEGFRTAAKFQCDRALAVFADCLSRGEWPGYDEIAVPPPPWLLTRWDAAELLDAAE
jgi:hypothetical protein